jgi:hypothetical protein
VNRYSALVVIFLLFVGSVFFVRPVFATFSFGIDSVEPSSINSKEQSLIVHLSISDLPSESYFRVGWQESDGKPYFGYMQNNAGDWVQIQALNSDCKKYYKVTDLATNSASIIVKIGEDQDILSGSYLIKAHRFTASCSYSSTIPSTTITVVLPTPTPSSTPVPTAAPTNTPTPMPTFTNTPTPSRTPTPTKIPTPTSTPEATKSGKVMVLGEEITPKSKTQASSSGNSLKPLIISATLVGLGLAILSGVFVWKQRDAQKQDKQM